MDKRDRVVQGCMVLFGATSVAQLIYMLMGFQNNHECTFMLLFRYLCSIPPNFSRRERATHYNTMWVGEGHTPDVPPVMLTIKSHIIG